MKNNRFEWQEYRGIFYRLVLTQGQGWWFETKRERMGRVYEYSDETYHTGTEAEEAARKLIDESLDPSTEEQIDSEF